MIGDLGTQTSRFGYAGEDCPKAVFPSVRPRFSDPSIDRVGVGWFIEALDAFLTIPVKQSNAHTHTHPHIQTVGHVVGGGKAKKDGAAGSKDEDGMEVDEAGAGGGPKGVLGDVNLGLRRTDLDVRMTVLHPSDDPIPPLTDASLHPTMPQ